MKKVKDKCYICKEDVSDSNNTGDGGITLKSGEFVRVHHKCAFEKDGLIRGLIR